MDVVFALASRITVLNAGRVLADGEPNEIAGSRDVQEAYLGSPAESMP
jgi:branched-chain amino acid transport system ATP-binding protein